jgi:hypothetical protein
VRVGVGGGWVRGESGRLAGLPNSEGLLLASAKRASELVFSIAGFVILLLCYLYYFVPEG